MKYVSSWTDKTGKRRYRFRRGAVSEMLSGEPSTAEFLRRYAELLEASEPPAPLPDRSISALIDEYMQSLEWLTLKATTQRAYTNMLAAIRRDMGGLPAAEMERQHVKKMMAKFAATPAAANNRLKRLRNLFACARELGWCDHDPTRGVPLFRTGEIHTWAADELAAFEARWTIGTPERLAYALHLYTGQRKGDVRRMGWGDISDGTIRVVQEKTGAKLWIPLHPDLAAILDQTTRRHLVIVHTRSGAPRTDGGYGNWFRSACQAAKLPERCSSHGLRKAAAAKLAEAGCSTKEIQAITGHRSLSEVERYTRGAEQKRLAKAAMARIVKPGSKTVKPGEND